MTQIAQTFSHFFQRHEDVFHVGADQAVARHLLQPDALLLLLVEDAGALQPESNVESDEELALRYENVFGRRMVPTDGRRQFAHPIGDSIADVAESPRRSADGIGVAREQRL